MKNKHVIFLQDTPVYTYGIKSKLIFLSVLICFICGNIFAQQKISLEDAVKMALQNNSQIKNEQLKTAYAKALIKTATDIPKTNVVAEYGQINSAYNDTKFGITQSVSFPAVYKKQKQLLTEDYKAALLGVSLREYEIKKAVTEFFYAFVYLKEKQKLLLQADTLYSKFYQKASLRLQKGESNILEKTTAETQKATIAIQLRQVQQAIELNVLQLQLLLNTTQIVEPFVTSYKMPFILITDSSSIASNPVLQMLQQQKIIARGQTDIEKAKLLPDLSLGYFSNSFKGTGADNKLYDGSTRFSSVQVGVGIPIFTKGQKAKIAASELQQQVLQSQYDAEFSALKNQYSQILSHYNSNVEIVKYYETEGLKNADIILQTANRQFANGDINYLDFVMLTNQAINIQSNYVEAVKALNESIIAINFITLR